MPLHNVHAVSITILMDNCTDLLLTNSYHARRPPLIVDERYNLPAPVAENGFSALVSTFNYDKESNNMFLLDAGVSDNRVIHNADLLEIRLDQIDGIILSHGHFDHFTGLTNVLRRISSKRSSTVDIFSHPDAFLRRWEIYPNGKRARLPFLEEKQLKELGATIHKNSGIKLLPTDANSSLLITGEIPRNTIFEKGFPSQYAEKPHNNNDDNEKNLNLVPDTLVKDDQAIVMNVRNKGLVVITGCGHAGIINSVDYARKVTGVDKIHAIIGGFHLPADGGIFEEAIDSTLKELRKIDPEYIVPCRCAGWKATNRLKLLLR
jgi:7,8-dihydropterin-6-yl-methyl-4-(beta-D-ribofuranosyl)aminobenzene 5'-phosphate synthase